MKYLLLSLIFLAPSHLAIGQIPDWYKEEIQRMEGLWITDNSTYKSENEKDDEYALEWRFGMNPYTMEGTLYGLRNGIHSNNYWDFTVFYDDKNQKARIIQINGAGTVGEGHLIIDKEGTRIIDQIFRNTDGSSSRLGHKSIVHDGFEVTSSYTINEDTWNKNRTYKWVKQKDYESQNDLAYELYLSQITSAEALLQLNKISKARQILASCEVKYRNIEWYFLNRFLDQSKYTITRPEKATFSEIKFHPDGDRFAVGSSDGFISIYSFPEVKLLQELKGHEGSVTTIDFSQDGNKLVSGGRDHTIILWDVLTKKIMYKNDTSFTQGIYQVRFSPDQSMIGVVSWERLGEAPYVNGFGKLLDADTGTELKKLDTEPHPADEIQFTKNGENVVIACWGEIVISFNAKTGLKNWEYDLTEKVEYNAFYSSDLNKTGEILLLGGADKRIHVVSVDSGVVLHRIESWEGHTNSVRAIKYSHGGDFFATAGDDQTINIWKADGYEKVGELIGHTGAVEGLQWSTDDTHIISSSRDGTIKVWDLQNRFLKSYDICNDGPWQAPFNHQQIMAAPCSDDRFAFYNLETGENIFEIENQTGLCGDFGKTDQYFVTAGFDGKIKYIDVFNARVIHSYSGNGSRVDGIVLLDSKDMIVAAGGNEIAIYNVQDTTKFKSLIFDNRPFRVVANADQSLIFVGFGDGEVKVIDTNSWEEIKSFNTENRIYEMVISHHDEMIAIQNGEEVEVRESDSGKLLYALSGHERPGYAVGFSPDDAYLITGSYDHTFKFWNLKNGRCTMTFNGFEKTVYNSKFMDKHKILVTSSQGDVYVFDFKP